MVDLGLATKILGVCYDNYFENYILGISNRNKETCVDGDKNEILKAFDLLDNEYLIEFKDIFYVITPSGIEKYEESLQSSAIQKRITQRKMILSLLKEQYDVDTTKNVEDKEIAEKIGSENKNELDSQLKYLGDIGLIDWQPFSGVSFARLTAEGAKRFETFERHDYQTTQAAYRTLFILENHLRKFIENKLIEHHKADWWDNGITKGLRETVISRKTDEAKFPWKVSETKTDMEYLQFKHLSRIIENQFEIFNPIFPDLSQIKLRLDELEEIRNAIAHTRTLSSESLTRLEQYSNDIFKLTS